MSQGYSITRGLDDMGPNKSKQDRETKRPDPNDRLGVSACRKTFLRDLPGWHVRPLNESGV